MPLPEPRLDDLRFQQDLVDEARRRIINYCPEWTDYNLSDPGITLIELFAWMTEQLTYRLNRVPEKAHLQFLNLIGLQIQPANSARVELTFRLSTPLPINQHDDTQVIVPIGTEIATRQTEESAEITFTTDSRLIISPPHLTDLRRDSDFHKNYLSRLGIETFHVFNAFRPQIGDTFYLGFEPGHNPSGHILQLEFESEETEATGVKRSDPPLVWEVAQNDKTWLEIKPSQVPTERDTTGGLNNPRGVITFYLPLDLQPSVVNGRTAYWVRCRLEQRHKEQGMYSQSPKVLGVRAFAMGATTRATHAVFVYAETLGVSNGEAGQLFRLENAPVLALQEGETVEVEEKRNGELVFIPWQLVKDFSNSTRYDRHFTLDGASGELAFGPCIRQADGNMRQYGRIPEAGRTLRFSRYRHGGGVIGNVPPNRIEVLKNAIPYIDRVTNMNYAEGGRDQETLEEAKMRARRELHAQQRAVTDEDFENLAKSSTRQVARAKSLTPGNGSSNNLPPGMIELVVIPAVFDSLKQGDLGSLMLDAVLLQKLQAYLDQYRLLTTSIRIREPQYIGLKVVADIVATEYSHPETVRQRVLESLQRYLSPLAIGDEDNLTELTGQTWEGWPFGRTLFQSELFTLIQRVPGVKHVLEVRISQRRVVPAQERKSPTTPETNPTENQPAPVTQRRVDIPADAVFCSLEHEIRMVDL